MGGDMDGPERRLRGAIITVCLAALLGACGGGGGYDGGADPVNSGGSQNPPVTTPPPGGSSNADLAFGKQVYQSQCASCHGSQGQGGIAQAIDTAQSCPKCSDQGTLESYIAAEMPDANPGSCFGDCARDVAAFIMAGFDGAGAPAPGGDGGNGGGAGDGGSEPPPAAGDPDAGRGQGLYAQQCASCHGASGKGGIAQAIDSPENCPSCASQSSLAAYIDAEMPDSNPASCTGSCAQDIAAFIRAQIYTDASEPPVGDGGGDGGTGGDPDPDPDPDPPPPPPAPKATCSVDFRYASEWNSGFVAEVLVINDGDEEVSDWEVRFNFPDGQVIGNRWNTELQQSGAAVVAKPKDYNRTIGPGSSQSFGFQGEHGGSNGFPQELAMDAEGCVVEAPVPEPPPPEDTACADNAPAPRLQRLLTRWEYDRTLRDLIGLPMNSQLSANFPVEARKEGYDNNARVNVITSRHVDEYLLAAQAAAEYAVAQHPELLYDCNPGTASCKAEFVSELGRRAFRRPLSNEERQRYEALFADELSGGSFDTGVETVVAAMLLSPNFLYRSEVGTESTQAGLFVLSAWERASALSYLIWGSTPDDQLLDAAASGALNNAAGREAQASRLLADPRAREQMAEFGRQWLGTDYFFGLFKDPDVYPRFNDQVRESMDTELVAFLNHVSFDSGDGSLLELLLADYVMVDGTLRQFYGLPGNTSDPNFSQQPVSGGIRGGVLGLGAVLASHAHATESSPIKRGVFVRERLLCHDLPDPPPDVDTTPPGLDPSLTTRERFAQHTDNENCASCHKFIDGLGFGLERYDGVGDYRSTENGKTVDDSGELHGREGFQANTIDSFFGGRQLAQLLADSDSAKRCAVVQHYRFARGYLEQGADDCSLDNLETAFRDDNLRLQDLLINFVRQDSFVLRRGQ